ncbi:MAG: sulfatase-like hydrolase/transferase [Luteitalea sp.]|nr:sulfatase-like hydrolase/transferase [Luteitalea sp.]
MGCAISKLSICVAVTAWITIAHLPRAAGAQQSDKPNIIFIWADNLGYGDLACFGSTKHRTPNIDRMAEEGMKLTNFYAAATVCTPSRAALMTGSYPRRVGLDWTDPDGVVLRPVSPNGLHPDEVTIAEVLKEGGYATAHIGKWHLGDQPAFLPTRQGFDYYFGIPYSDDMTPDKRPAGEWPPLPLMRNEEVIEAQPDRNLLTKREADETIRFIKENRNRPFFIWLSQAMPGSTNRPFASESFQGRSANGPYGDSVEELDWAVGQILRALDDLGLENRTLVIYASDNGAVSPSPARPEGQHGSNAPLSGFCNSIMMEGGMRVPFVARWPGTIPAGRVSDELATTMDMLPTFAHLGRGNVPRDRIIDGHDIWPLLAAEPGAKSPYVAFFYYHRSQLLAVRSGKWKLQLPLPEQAEVGGATQKNPAGLYDLTADIGETRDLSRQHPAIVAQLSKLLEQAREDLGDGSRTGSGQRPVGRVENPRPQLLTGQPE